MATVHSTKESDQDENLEDWIESARPVYMEDWEWFRFLVSISRIVLKNASVQSDMDISTLILSVRRRSH